jgi:hypothetical protein
MTLTKGKPSGRESVVRRATLSAGGRSLAQSTSRAWRARVFPDGALPSTRWALAALGPQSISPEF